jgi:UDPglucose 6-dehydrogenase
LVVETGRVPAQGAARIERTLAMYGVPGGSAIEVAAGPVFFREGSAVEDFLHPDRVVVGVRSPRGEARLRELYAPLLGRRFPCPVHATCPSKGAVPFLATDVSTAELIRYATTVFLATKISFINAVADLCERLGADVQQVTEGVGLDRRIGREALGAGLGFGGPCLPGDVLAFLHIADEVGVDLGLVREVEQVNRRRIKVAVEKLRRALRTLQGKRVGLLGLAFKPETDDLRGSPALALVPRLVGEGADVVGYDPKAGAAAGLLLPTMAVVNDPYAVAEQADALVLATEWPEFLSLEWGRLKRVMRRPVVLDGRNALDREKLQAEGFEYLGMGR